MELAVATQREPSLAPMANTRAHEADADYAGTTFAEDPQRPEISMESVL
jgi:hypothetical protein